ncbi:MAG TPA: hypothetical protein VIW24_24450 [Aldersonia sp.]
MAEVKMSAAAADALETLYDSNDPLAELVDRWLDALERNPGAAAVKRRLIRPGKVYAIAIHNPRGDDWLILWEHIDNNPVVHYLGPNTLTG